MRRVVAGVFVSVCLVSVAPASAQEGNSGSPTQYDQALRQLHWVDGPHTATLFEVASLSVPADFVFLNPEDTARFNELNHNLAGGEEYVLAPADLHWIAYFRFSDIGYVKDNEAIDADDLLKTIRRDAADANVERRRRGWSEMSIAGWHQPPAYNTETRHLEWAIDARNTSNESVINFNTRILGRRGVTSVTLVSDEGSLDTAIGEFKAALRAYSYLPQEQYAAFKPGDRIAEYGLAALITGGAAAVATKTGLWKTIGAMIAAAWKLIAVGVAGVVAALRKMFGQPKSADAAQS